MSGVFEVLTQDFMVTALLTASLVGVACAVLSCFVVLKGWSLMGDAVSHAILPGVAVAAMVGVPLSLGAFVSGVACVGLSGWLRNSTRLKPDTAMGVVFTGLFGLGLVLVAATPSDVHLKHILYGNLLGIERAELVQAVAACVGSLVVLALLGRDVRLVCFDPAHARVIGLPAGLLQFVLLAVLSATVVASIQAVGLILVVAMLITPGAIGVMMADRFGPMLAWAAGSTLAASVAGTFVSYWVDGATGPCIVLALAAPFAATT
ncbi:MAG: metal ABC transporter permease, partial [Phycisphaeraceae bacterium]|nr:metal ABC transporter permease [Phycisphaeraceae bacterium]